MSKVIFFFTHLFFSFQPYRNALEEEKSKSLNLSELLESERQTLYRVQSELETLRQSQESLPNIRHLEVSTVNISHLLCFGHLLERSLFAKCKKLFVIDTILPENIYLLCS